MPIVKYVSRYGGLNCNALYGMDIGGPGTALEEACEAAKPI